ncbi:MAG: PKD domain-containing protein [Euryarchaeota archaeon]|nr:PKD domain-containing protein [Euryarchaeota archaeon]
MKNKKHTNFRVEAIFVAIILLSMSTLIPASQSLPITKENSSDPKNTFLTDTDFSITIHRIAQIDEIDPMPWDQADWRLYMYVNGEEKTYECVGDDIILDTTFTWEGIIANEVPSLDVDMRLMDRDDWPSGNDIADISAYPGGGIDDSDEFPRGAILLRTYDLTTNEWAPVDENNDFLVYEYDSGSGFYWYLTSGNFDGSTTWDENDAAIWFDISVGNRPPIAPTKPVGPQYGEVYTTYDFSTQSMDPDGDDIRYGWDWNGDYQIDEFTDYYESWETATISHTWTETGIYYVRVVAVDINGMIGEWSDSLAVEINGPGGISGFKAEEWSLGHVYTLYMDHEDTQNLIYQIQNAQYVIDAVAALIIAIAAACGYPLDLTIATAIAVAIVQLGVAVIGWLDQGMGIYFRAYTIDVNGFPALCVAYVWSQTDQGTGAEDNTAPYTPVTPSGPAKGRINKEYTYSSSTTDIDDDRVFYIFDWGDDSYGFTDWYNSSEVASLSHNWSKKGNYNIRVKSIDEHNGESAWSDPLAIRVPRYGPSMTLLEKLFERFPNAFPILRHWLGV